MGDWGGAPPGWVPPEDRAELAAAQEAAEKMAAARQLEDDRTAAIVTVIDRGFATLSAAIMVAAGVSDADMRDFWHPNLSGQPAPDPASPTRDTIDDSGVTYVPDHDPDLDDLITDVPGDARDGDGDDVDH